MTISTVPGVAYHSDLEGLAAELAAIELVSPPVGFQFNFTNLVSPLSIYKSSDGAVRWDYDHSSLIPVSCKTAPLSRIIHVSNSGSTGNTGVGAFVGDFSNAKTSVASAITYGNSLGDGYQIIIAPGTYLRNNTWTIAATQPVWIRGWYDVSENRPILSSHDDLTWSLDGTYTNLYKATRSVASRVIDTTTTDSTANYTELLKVASLSTADSTPNSWYTDGTTVYVRRTDGAAPTVNTTWVELGVSAVRTGATANDIYVEGIRFFGGLVSLDGRPGNSACFVDCDFKFQGGEASPDNAVSVLDYNVAVFVRCVASKGYKDGFNGHKVGANIPQIMTLDCVGFANGDVTQTSCNGWTTHDGIKAIDINGRYYNNRGANFIPVDANTQTWAVNSRCSLSVHDGTFPPTNYYFLAGSEAWLDGCEGEMSHNDVVAGTGALVHLRDHTSAGAFVSTNASGGAVIDSY